MVRTVAINDRIDPGAAVAGALLMTVYSASARTYRTMSERILEGAIRISGEIEFCFHDGGVSS